MENLRSQTVRGMRWTGSSQVITGVMQFVQIAVLANILTPTEFGLMATVLLSLNFISAFADAGVSFAIIQAKEMSDVQRSTLYWVHNGIAGITAIAFFWIAPQISALLIEPELGPEPIAQLTTLLRVSAFMIPITAASTQFRMVFHRNMEFAIVAKQEILTTTLNLIFSVVLAIAGYGVWSLLVGYMLGNAIGQLWILVEGLRTWKPSLVFNLTGLKPVFRYGMYHSGEKIVQFLNLRIDQILITTLLGLQALGIYNMALNLVIYPIQRINQAVTQVMFPLFAKQQDDVSALRNGYLNLLKTVTLINAPLMVGIMITAPLFIPLLLGDQWTNAIVLTQILAIYSYQKSTGAPAGALLLAVGRTDIGFAWNVLAMVFTLPVIAYSAMHFGLTGIAYGFVILHLFLGAVYYLKVIRPIIGPVGADYAMTLVKPVLYAAMMGFVVRLLDHLLPFDTALQLSLLVVIGIGLYTLLLFVLERPILDRIKDVALPKRTPS